MANKAAIERMEAERRAVIKAVNKLYAPVDLYTIQDEAESLNGRFIEDLSVIRVLVDLCDQNLLKHERGKYAKTTDDDLCEIFGIK